MSKKKQDTPVEEPVETTIKNQEASENAENEPLKQEESSEQDAENAELQQQYDELKDKYMRMLAEFDNYKKRMMRERLDLINTAAKDTMTAILPVLDDFDRAKKNADDENSTEVFTDGVALVYNKLFNTLKQKGLQAMDSDGQPFDPEWHEALTEIPAPSEDLKGKVIDTIEKGYLLNDKIIRYAKVVVGK